MFQKAHKLTFNQRLVFQFPSTISKRTRTRFVETKSKHEHWSNAGSASVHICAHSPFPRFTRTDSSEIRP